MATPKLLHLRSSVRGKLPAAGAIQVGQIGVNYSSQDPFLCIKDTSGIVRRVGGVAMTATAPTSPQNGDLWVDLTVATSPVLKVWDGGKWAVASGGVKSGTTAPTPAAAGDVWVDLSGAAPVMKVYNGVTWNAVDTTPGAATTSTAGIVQLAAAADVTSGASDRVVTADQLKAVDDVANKAATDITALNGKVVDASTAVKGIIQLATGPEVTAGTDAVKAVTPATLKTELDKKAPLASPALTGTPTAPTAAAGTSTTQLATTAFVAAATPDATESVKGLVELATAAETTTGADATRATHPAGVKAAIDAAALWQKTGTTLTPKTSGDKALSSDVNFTQAGASAKSRTVEAKLRDVISVKDFGATGDGTTDDTAAIQAAINAARAVRGAVYFPPNNPGQFYKITAPLTCDGPITITGAGPQAVVIYAMGLAAGKYVLDFDLPVATNYFFGIRDITLRSDNGAPSGIRLKNTSYCALAAVQLHNLTDGVVITGSNCFSNRFQDVGGNTVSGSTVRFQAFTGGGHYTFNHCNFTGGYGLRVDSDSAVSELAIVSSNFEQCVTNSAYVLGTVQGLSFVGCRTEGLDGTADFLLYPAAGNSVTGLSVTGCYFTTDAGASVPVFLGGNGGAVRGFTICGNHVKYAAANNFVTLNGDGESGLIAGNYFSQAATTPTNVQRDGVVVFANENASGKCAEYWGTVPFGPLARGTFTPGWVGTTVAGNAVPRYAYGRYNRNGSDVTIHIVGDYLLNSATTLPTGQVKITGLPFASTASFDQHVSVHATRVDHTMPLVGRIPAGTTDIFVEQENSSQLNNNDALDWSAVRNPYGSLALDFTYIVQ